MENIDNDDNGNDDNGNLQTFAHRITLQKIGKRSLNEDKITEQIETLIARIQTRTRVERGWRVARIGETRVTVTGTDVERTNKQRTPAGIKTYEADITISCDPNRNRTEKQMDSEFRNMVSVLVAASGRYPNWEVSAVDGVNWTETAEQIAGGSRADDFVGYASFEIPGNWRARFSHIFERESQIALVMTSFEAAVQDNWSNESRFHALFVGTPGCGKSEVAQTIKRIFGSDAVMSFDGTALTQAGFIKSLTEKDDLPRVIVIEEIEKCDPVVLRVLLGMMDTRGEIRKVTARDDIERDARVIVIGTCNSLPQLEAMHSGAVASRFGEPIFFPKPDRKLLQKILMREVKRVEGNEQWIDPVLDYCDMRHITDPRRAISFCLRGRDGWLDGSFMRHLENVREIGASLNE